MSKNDTYIFIDTCSLLVSCWDVRRDNSVSYNSEKDCRFWKNELPNLACVGTVILTKRNYDELEKLSHVHDDASRPLLGERCGQVLSRIAPLVTDRTISIVGDPNDPFADAILLSVALKFRTQKNLLFLTQDRALATDLVAISNFQSVRPRKGFELKVRRLDSRGSIERWRFDSASPVMEEEKSRRIKARGRSSFSMPITLKAPAQLPEQEWWR